MSTPQLAAYTFLPWVRRGFVRAVSTPDEPGAALAARVTLPVVVRVEGTDDVSRPVRLLGPGDVTGLDPNQVVRTDPPPGSRTFEPGYVAQVELGRADLPWLFTPAAAGTGGTRLRPWLVLVVVRRRDGVRLEPSSGGPLPVLEIGSRGADELPDLTQSWAWAHAQVAGVGTDSTPADVLLSDPGRTRSRLLCPRRLEPDTAYLACVVPAFAVGVTAGLGAAPKPADEERLDPAWTAGATSVRLPVYHWWEFSTAAGGSFETLARRLTPQPLDATVLRPPRLDLHDAGGGLPALDPAAEGVVVELRTVLRAEGPETPPPWPDATRVPFQAALERLIGAADADALSPPVYGQVQARADVLPPEGADPAWLRECNLDPRLRVAAAAGARVVQDRQEELMARAWEQVGAVRDANAVLRRMQVARELGGTLMERHLQRMRAADLLAVTRPAHEQVEISGETVAGELRASRLPEAVVSGAMRRFVRPGGPIARRAAVARADVLGAVARVALTPPPAAPAGMVASGVAQPPVLAAPAAALSADSVQARLVERLRPDATVLDRARTVVEAPAETWARPDPLAPVATTPVFEDPMYEALQQTEPALFLPGLDRVAPDSVALLETTPAVIEAFLLGLNHEMARELLWREFPADLTATPFRQFWDVRGRPGEREPLFDIPPVAEWAPTPLGSHLRASDEQLVLVVRGELLRRHPATTIFAARARPDSTLDAASRLAPLFRGSIAPDVALVGFALSEDAARGLDPPGPGWYFAFEQHPTAPRFGFDETAGPGMPQAPDDLAWTHVPVGPSGHVDVEAPLTAGPALQAAWGRDAANTAHLAFQQPFRIALHASRLLPAREGTPA